MGKNAFLRLKNGLSQRNHLCQQIFLPSSFNRVLASPSQISPAQNPPLLR